jgi:hypothetical protein
MILARLDHALQPVIGVRRAWALTNLVAEVQAFLTVMSSPCCGPSSKELYDALERLGIEKKLQTTVDEILKEDDQGQSPQESKEAAPE